MGVSVLADENGAVLYCNTEMEPVGPVIRNPVDRTESGHRAAARRVQEEMDRDPRKAPERLAETVSDVKDALLTDSQAEAV